METVSNIKYKYQHNDSDQLVTSGKKDEAKYSFIQQKMP